jgi:hypothetical protein
MPARACRSDAKPSRLTDGEPLNKTGARRRGEAAGITQYRSGRPTDLGECRSPAPVSLLSLGRCRHSPQPRTQTDLSDSRRPGALFSKPVQPPWALGRVPRAFSRTA